MAATATTDLSGPRVGRLIEALQQVAPVKPVHPAHLAGAVGRGLDQFAELDWIERAESTGAVRVTPDGAAGFRKTWNRPLRHATPIS